MEDIGDYDSLSPEDRMALTALCTEYAWRKDFFHVEKIAELFTEDCVWYPVPGTTYAPTTIEGRQAVHEAWTKRSREFLTRTMISNLRFVKDGPKSARGWVNFTEYAVHVDEVKVPIPLMVGDWLDTYEKCADGKWRIKTKRSEIKFGGLRVVK